MSSLRLLVDINAGLAIATALRDAGHDVLFAGDLDWRMPDADMLSLANREQRIILTMDTDFGELIYSSGLAHKGILLLRMPGPAGSKRSRWSRRSSTATATSCLVTFACTARASCAFVASLG